MSSRTQAGCATDRRARRRLGRRGRLLSLGGRRGRLLSLGGLLLALLALGAFDPLASASAQPSIEGLWSFNGGKVQIHPGPEGTFVGTVVEPTKFAQCTHNVGEEMWTDMRLQTNGSYWGLHQWFYETAECVKNPTRGPTAWRVLQDSTGASYLLVCFSYPGTTQPTISPTGVTTNATYGPCVKSAEVAPAVGVESFANSVGLPGNQKCYSRRDFRIHLHQPKYDPFEKVLVTLGRHRLSVIRHGNTFAATIDLKGLPRGAFTVRIHITTVLGHRFSGHRTYHTCIPKLKPAKGKRHRTSSHDHG
jgi:hypothetical protein